MGLGVFCGRIQSPKLCNLAAFCDRMQPCHTMQVSVYVCMCVDVCACGCVCVRARVCVDILFAINRDKCNANSEKLHFASNPFKS